MYTRELAAAEAAESAGRYLEASKRYDDAADAARLPRDGDHARYLAARALARSGDRADAASRLRAIAAASPRREDSAEAANTVADLEIQSGDDDGWTALLGVAQRFPEDGVSRRALRRYIAHEDERRGALAELDDLARLAVTFERTALAETVAYEIALHEAAVGQDDRARDAFVAVARRWPYPGGVFWDDSLYRASVLDEKRGRIAAALADLDAMLAERTSSWIVGSYERPRYEPAMVRRCALLRDELREHARARGCFHRLYADFTTSELRDDALWEEARIAREDGDRDTACAPLATLVHEFRDSRYVPCAIALCPSLRRAPASVAPATCHPYIAQRKLGTGEAPTSGSPP